MKTTSRNKINNTYQLILKTTITIVLMIMTLGVEAQDNSLSNSSFEYHQGIPSHHSMFNNCVRVWENALPIGVSTPDFYLKSSNCNFTSWQTVYESVKVKDPSQFHGCGFAGIFINYNNQVNSPKFKEYFVQKIDLVAGHKYRVALDVARSVDSTSDNLEFDLGIYGYVGTIPATNINYCVTQSDGSLAPLLGSIPKDSIKYDLKRFYIEFTPVQNASYIMFGGTGCGINAIANGYVFIDNITLTDSLATILNPKIEYLSGETRGCCYSKSKEEFQLMGNLPQDSTTLIKWQQKLTNPELVTFLHDTNFSTGIAGFGFLTPGTYEFYYTFQNGISIATDTLKINVNPGIPINAGIDQIRLSTNMLAASSPGFNPMCGMNSVTLKASPDFTTINNKQYLSWWSMISNDGTEWVFPNYAVPYDGLYEGTVYVEDNSFYLGIPSNTNNQGNLLNLSLKNKNPGYHPDNTFWIANGQDSIQFIWHIKDLCENIYTDTVLVVQNKVEIIAPITACMGDTVEVIQYTDAFIKKLKSNPRLGFNWTILSGHVTFLNSTTRSDSSLFIINTDTNVTIRLTVIDSLTGAVFYCEKTIIVNLDEFSAGPNQIRQNTACASSEFKMEAIPCLSDINIREYQTWWSMIRNDGSEWVFPNYCIPFNGLDEGTVYVDSNRYISQIPDSSCNQGQLQLSSRAYKNPGWHPNNTFTLRNAQDSVIFIWHIKDHCGHLYKDSVLVVQNRVNISATNTCNDQVIINSGDSILLYQVYDSSFYRISPKIGLQFLWSKTSGPGVVNFLNPVINYDSMMIRLTTPGVYEIRLTVFDSIQGINFYCDKKIYVKIATYANAGLDQIICNDSSHAVFKLNAKATLDEVNNNCFQTWWSMIRENGSEWIFPNHCVPFHGLNEGSVFVENNQYYTPVPTTTCNQKKLSAINLAYKNPGWHPNNKFTFTSYGIKKFIWHVKDNTTGNIATDTVILSWSYDENINNALEDIHPTCNTTFIMGELSGASGGIGSDYRWRQIDGPMLLETSDTNRNGLYIYNLDSAAIGTYSFEYRKGKNSCFVYDTIQVIIDSHIITTSTISLSTSYSGANLCNQDTVSVIATGGVQYAFLVNGVIEQDFSTNNTFTYANFIDTSIIDVISILSSDGCLSRGINPITVNVNYIPTPNITTPSNQVCLGDSIALTATCNLNHKIKWLNNRNISLATELNGPNYHLSSESFYVRPLVTTRYYAIAFDSITGCISTIDSIIVTVNPIPTITSTANPKIFCAPGGTSTLIGRCSLPNILIKWYDNPNRIGSPLNVGGTLPSAAFNHYFSTTDTVYGFAENQITGCVSNFSMQIIKVNTPPSITAFVDDTIHVCENSRVLLTSTLSPILSGSSIRWYNGSISSTSILTTALSYNYLPTSSSLIYAVPTYAGCLGLQYDSVFVQVNALPINPTAINNSDDTICRGSSVLLSIDSIPSNCMAIWYNGSSILDTGNYIIVNPVSTTNYHVYFVNSITGCRSSLFSQTMVYVNPKPNAGVDKTICQYSSVQLSAFGSGYWTSSSLNPSTCIFSSSIINNPTLSGFDQFGSYEFYWVNNSGCLDTMKVTVKEKPDAGNDLSICNDEQPTLNTISSIGGTWSSVVGNPIGGSIHVIDSNSMYLSYSATATGIYNYSFTSNGCKDTIQLNVLLKANAGADKHIKCYTTDSVIMTANGTGTWTMYTTSMWSPHMSATTDPHAVISDFHAVGTYYLIWNNSICEDTAIITVSDSCFTSIIDNQINQPIQNNICISSDSILIEGLLAQPLTGNYQWIYNSGAGYTIAPGISNEQNYYFNSFALGTYQFARIYTTISGYLLTDTSNSITINIIANDTLNLYETICAGSNGKYDFVDYHQNGIQIYHYNSVYQCDSVILFNLTILPEDTTNISLSTCTPISINDQIFSSNGIYFDTLSNEQGCDSLVIYHINFNPKDTTYLTASICSNTEYFFNDQYLYNAGIYDDTLISSTGCDSIILLNLQVSHPFTIQMNRTICYGEQVVFGSHVYTEEGIYIDSSTRVNGCDSFIYLTLFTLPVSDTNLFYTFCSGQSIEINNHTYATSGNFTDTLTSINGCDSLVHISIQILEPRTSNTNYTICSGSSIQIIENIYSSAGIYFDTIISSIGCDSIIQSNVTILTPNTENYYETVCEGYYYNSTRINNDTIIYDTLFSNNHCDSSYIIMHFHVNSLPPFEVSNDTNLCMGKNVVLVASGGNNTFIWVNVLSNSQHEIYGEDTLYFGSHYRLSPTENMNLKVYNYDCNYRSTYKYINVNIAPKPTIDILNTDTCLYYGQSLLLTSDHSGGNLISWINESGVLCTNCESIKIPALMESTYFAIIQDSFGCAAIDSFNLCINNDCNDSTIEIPNLITANQDGINDLFYIKNPENIPIVYTRIYDRWGMVMYSSSEQEPKWDGTYNGEKCNSGVYAYVIEARCQKRTNIVKSGNISIVK